jgi:hypothetical protein
LIDSGRLVVIMVMMTDNYIYACVSFGNVHVAQIDFGHERKVAGQF